MENEIWKDIKGYEGYYQVSNKGNVKSLDRMVKGRHGYPKKTKGKIKKQQINKDGYWIISLCCTEKGYTQTTKTVHRLVAEAFIPNPENKHSVNHKDGNKLNPCLENLEWVTISENTIHGYRVLSRKPNKTGTGKFGKLNATSRPVNQIDLITNEIIKTYECIRMAQEELKICHIGDACRGLRNSAGGFKWEFSEC